MTAQEAAATTYRDAERRLRHRAIDALRADDEPEARRLLSLAQSVGVAMVRENRNVVPQPDEWEMDFVFPDGNTPRDGMWR